LPRQTNEDLRKAPHKAEKGLQDKVGCVHKEHVPLTRLSFLQTGLELLLEKFGRLCRVRLGRNLSNLEAFQAQARQERPYLRGRTAQTGELFDPLYGLVDRFRWTGLERLFQRGAVVIQFTGGAIAVHLLQFVQPTRLIVFQAAAHSRLTDPRNLTDVLVGKIQRFQVRNLATLLHVRVGMMKTLVVQFFDFFFGELHAEHQTLHLSQFGSEMENGL
jgi:hypothetical protein